MQALATPAALRALVPVEAPAGVELWRLELDPLSGSLAELLPRLPPGERERCLRYHRPADRLRYALCRVVLRQLLAQRLHCVPQEVEIEIDAHGKPRLAQPADLHFNLSHTGRCALIALSTVGPVGVDIERVSTTLALADLQAGLSPSEQRYCAHSARVQTYFQVWCGKEAVLKALGLGLAGPLHRVSALPVARRRYVVDLPFAAPPVQAWQLPAPAGHVGALALQLAPA